ncbi:hypothetical protein [Burkholderia multivorans]|uniref:hypothetical protein n=1 Tax=Burkholderia multivorans TaxID=87883 RepID=UPI0012D9E5D8|nr:hypothetical protein [Burkholderia multivorans]MBU9250923.1 hypothetical protein [Burkholderia multivorans]MBU9255383.1 hypothetical protein [Burkholderia multivorans]MDN7757374.1 hypothetical protein [Burkholderia multivorans]MDN8101073.1 hypothetical protein [Burkholderia multivorans]
MCATHPEPLGSAATILPFVIAPLRGRAFVRRLRCGLVAAAPLLVVQAPFASLLRAGCGGRASRVRAIFRRDLLKFSNWEKFAKFDEMFAARSVAFFYIFVKPAQGTYRPQAPAGRAADGRHMRISA